MIIGLLCCGLFLSGLSASESKWNNPKILSSASRTQSPFRVLADKDKTEILKHIEFGDIEYTNGFALRAPGAIHPHPSYCYSWSPVYGVASLLGTEYGRHLLQAIGLPEPLISDDHNIHSVEIANNINTLYKEGGLSAPEFAIEGGGSCKSSRFTDETHYITGPFINDPQINHENKKVDSVALNTLIKAIYAGHVTDPTPSNLRVTSEGKVIYIDTEDIAAGANGSREEVVTQALVKLYHAIAQNTSVSQEVKSQIQEQIRSRTLWHMKYWIAGTVLLVLYGVQKAVAWRNVAQYVRQLRTVITEHEASSTDDILEQLWVELGPQQKNIQQLCRDYIDIYKESNCFTSQHVVLEKKLRSLWWQRYSIRSWIWNAIQKIFSKS